MKIAEMDIQQRQKECQGLQNRKLLIKTTRMFLLTSGTSVVSAQSIRTINNSLYSIKTTKRGLSAYDDKKYILDDKISTLSYGHYKLV